MFRLLFVALPFLPCLGDVSRFLSPLDLESGINNSGTIIKSNAVISPSFSGFQERSVTAFSSESESFILNQHILETKIGEAILHRHQCNGSIRAQITRQWKPLKISSSFILKVIDCIPDELSPSSFIRFEIWDMGKLIGQFGEPFRLGHIVDVMVLRESISRGQIPSNSILTTKPMDVLRGHADAIPANTVLDGYQMASTVSVGSPLKWSNLSKINLVRRGDVVDVFASGGGIFITMKGISLDDGVKGGMIKIRNISSDKEFFAKVLNKNSVKVNL